MSKFYKYVRTTGTILENLNSFHQFNSSIFYLVQQLNKGKGEVLWEQMEARRKEIRHAVPQNCVKASISTVSF